LPLFFPVLSSSSLFFCRGSNNMNSCTFSIGTFQPKAGWWYTNPSEKYEFVTWDHYIPNLWNNIIHSCSKPPEGDSVVFPSHIIYLCNLRLRFGTFRAEWIRDLRPLSRLPCRVLANHLGPGQLHPKSFHGST
jgi:hypothetical protein